MQYYSYEATSLSGSSGPHYLAVATAKVNSLSPCHFTPALIAKHICD